LGPAKSSTGPHKPGCGLALSLTTPVEESRNSLPYGVGPPGENEFVSRGNLFV
jgi:hypothetical protein